MVFLSNLSLFIFMTVGCKTSSGGNRSSHSSSCMKPFKDSASVRNAINVIPIFHQLESKAVSLPLLKYALIVEARKSQYLHFSSTSTTSFY
jgi:hypothetical protein